MGLFSCTIAVVKRIPGAVRTGPKGRTDVTDGQIIGMHDYDDLSFSEIARRLHMSVTGVRSRYYGAKGIPVNGRRRAKWRLNGTSFPRLPNGQGQGHPTPSERL